MYFIDRVDIKIRYKIQQYMQKYFIPSTGILVFHEVYESERDCISREYAIDVNEFVEFIEILLSNKAQFGIIDEYINKKKIIITFDDGYACNIKTAYRILDENKIPYIIFMPTDFINKTGYMQDEEVKKLSVSKNAFVGAHSCTHCNLSACKEAKIAQELSSSKEILEKLLDMPVNYMSYPYGSLNAVNYKVIKAAKRAGYQAAFSTVCVDSRIFHNPWFYPRITVTSKNYRQIQKMLLVGQNGGYIE